MSVEKESCHHQRENSQRYHYFDDDNLKDMLLKAKN